MYFQKIFSRHRELQRTKIAVYFMSFSGLEESLNLKNGIIGGRDGETDKEVMTIGERTQTEVNNGNLSGKKSRFAIEMIENINFHVFLDAQSEFHVGFFIRAPPPF